MAQERKPKNEARQRTRGLTRRDFLRAVGVGVPLLGAAGCGGFAGGLSRLPEEYLPRGGPGTGGMNVILVILDSLRKDHVGAYGNDLIRTPVLDAVAREGLRFTRAHPEAMPTIPVRRAVHTGARTFPLGPPAYGWTSIPAGQTTLAEVLKSEGYGTFLVTDTYHQFSLNFGRGFDAIRVIRGQESDPYRDPASVSEEEMHRRYLIQGEGKKARQYLANVQDREREEDWFAPKVFLNAMELLEEAHRGKEPFFMVVDSYDPHEPWDPPRKYADLYDEGYEGKDPLNSNYGSDDYLTDRQLLRMRALYAGEVTMADRWLGEFLGKAHDTGVMERTLLVVVSDHGHAFGEHGVTGKPPYALWSEITDIVLLMRHPERKTAGQAPAHLASTHDVAPTILGALGIEPPSTMGGEDFSALFDGKDHEGRDYLTSGYKDHVWARDGRRVLFCRNDGSEPRLYDAQSDPRQERDLAGEEPDTVGRMFEDYVLKDAGGSLPPA
ncbi:MAG TPA: sulfatase [Rubrobacter sp.]|nr:sulfatase [Rubrobacter sp.]